MCAISSFFAINLRHKGRGKTKSAVPCSFSEHPELQPWKQHATGSVKSPAFLTAAGFCGSLFISWQICRARSSASVALSPLVMGLLWTFIWLLYSRETGDALVTRVAAHGYFLTAINVIVHRVFAEVAYSGWQMAVMLPLVYNARLAMGAKAARSGGVHFLGGVQHGSNYPFRPVVPAATH
ncbi:hypothetical protein MRX96_009588 [Rhipicephalus microplus]